MRKPLCVLILCVISLIAVRLLHAAAPPLIPHQGRILDGAGDPVADGVHTVTFGVYDADSAGTELWSSGAQPITTADGLYNYALGSNVALPVDLFAGGTERWLGVLVEGDPEATPRTQIAWAPYALEAQDAVLTQSLFPGTVGSAEIADSSISEQDIDQEEWIAPTFLNGWINYENGYNPAGYFKDINGVVHIRGLVRDGSVDVPIFSLPSGYRPQNSEGFVVWSSSSHIQITVMPNGDIVPSLGTAIWLVLDGITFRTCCY